MGSVFPIQGGMPIYASEVCSGDTTQRTFGASCSPSGGDYSFPAKVGIGTTGPQAPLEIQGSGYTPSQLILSQSEPTRYYGLIRTQVPAGKTILAFGGRSDDVNYFDTVNIVEGNVGIGTPIPSNTLDVNGKARIRGSRVYYTTTGEASQYFLEEFGTPRGSGTKSWLFRLSEGPDSSTYWDAILMDRTTDTSGNVVLAPSSGKVGIGTPNPQSKLQIGNPQGGGTAFSPALRVNAGTLDSTPGN